MSISLDIDHLQSWIGKRAEKVDIITPRLANSLAAVLDEDCELMDGAVAPLGIHWCLCADIAKMSALGSDGHPERGGFLPPVPLPRRMWAGGALLYEDQFLVGDEVRRVSQIDNVAVKTGRTGQLCFVTVSHEYHTSRGVALRERHDIVYRALERPSGEKPHATEMPAPDYKLAVAGTPTLLMRYSAVTFNGHRIHYDRDYCINDEFYPGLIVHGPLQANYLLRLAFEMNGNKLPKRFEFRGTSPLFDGSICTINGINKEDGSRELWVMNAEGVVTMKATSA